MNGNGDFDFDTWHGIQDVWRYWYTNGRENSMNHHKACLFASDKTIEKVSHACALFVDATRNFGMEEK